MLIASNVIFSIAAIYYTGNWVASCVRQNEALAKEELKRKLK
jgi:hypothetical protein